ncbi:hypothetical protein BKD09_24460 [Bradyrhizobium japonicum]|uniref:Uncharacterized protein n=1 Tax=Bradyrhizobium japonicum TaxID=375 RepID=A0A1L3FDX5_BRAJP|nr:hypothetical protein [Bradyrhizobium japonicum]APG11490.1 hypothetical protein BKD09_24460 [Bradyrhizobium japonicum]
MALTLDKEQKLERAELIGFFESDQAMWEELVKQSHTFLKSNFPPESQIRPDDVAKALEPIVEVHEGLRDFLSANKLTQKYWIGYFTELIIDRTWAAITD